MRIEKNGKVVNLLTREQLPEPMQGQFSPVLLFFIHYTPSIKVQGFATEEMRQMAVDAYLTEGVASIFNFKKKKLKKVINFANIAKMRMEAERKRKNDQVLANMKLKTGK